MHLQQLRLVALPFPIPSLSLLAILVAGCGDDSSSGGDDEIGGCEYTSGFDGEWSENVEDWSQAGNLTPKPEPYDDIYPHHAYLTAVHTIHLPFDELEGPPDQEPALMMFHGQHEERVWEIGSLASSMEWFPIGHIVEWEELFCDNSNPPNCGWITEDGYPDIFCAGHALLEDGRMLVAGGNVTGSGNGGGLVQTFTFNRATADPDEAMPDPDPQQFDDELYGWTRQGDMTYDRWYPTLTPLPDGRVLISGGASRTAGAHNTFEVYDPTTDTVELALDGSCQQI